MEIVDLTPNYLRYADGTSDYDEYRSSYPVLFDHYAAYWGGRGNSVTPILPAELVCVRRERVLHHINAAIEQLKECEISMEGIRAVLFVGNHLANGHAFLDGETSVAWFALETFESELSAKVFVMHELIHALHYRENPSFFFKSIEEKNSVSRQLIVEGITTYVTKLLWDLTDGEALWADALDPNALKQWITRCKEVEHELCLYVIDNFDSFDPSIHLFHAGDSDDVYSNRAGYYVGLKVIERIVAENQFTICDLLDTSQETMRKLVRTALAKVIL